MTGLAIDGATLTALLSFECGELGRRGGGHRGELRQVRRQVAGRASGEAGGVEASGRLGLIRRPVAPGVAKCHVGRFETLRQRCRAYDRDREPASCRFGHDYCNPLAAIVGRCS